MGGKQSIPEDNDTINWNKVRTANFSPTKNMINYNNTDATELVLNLNLLELSENSEFNIKYLGSNGLNNSNFIKKIDLNISENNENNSTSPFISSEMYKYVMNKYQQQNMVGGATNDLNDESETTSTSSSSESSDSSSSTPIKQKPAKGKAKGKKTKTTKKNTDAFLDYISSSAHTGGSITDNSSVANENNITVSSVRTSQINLISE